MDAPRSALASVLPPPLALPQSESADWPCLVAFGEQRDSTAFVGGVPFPWGVRYCELMVSVPCGWRGGSDGGEVLFVVGMVCDAWWAVWNGNAYYGFRKRLAPMSWDGSRFVVNDGDAGRSFDAVIRPGAGACGALDLGWITRAAALPVIGCLDAHRLVQSRFQWEFLGAVTPVALDLVPGAMFTDLPLFATGSDCVYRVEDMRWRLSWPVRLLA